MAIWRNTHFGKVAKADLSSTTAKYNRHIDHKVSLNESQRYTERSFIIKSNDRVAVVFNFNGNKYRF